MSAWAGYVEHVLRPMAEGKARAKRERERVAKTLRIAADRIETERPADVVAWLRAEAEDLLSAATQEGSATDKQCPLCSEWVPADACPLHDCAATQKGATDGVS